MLLSLTAILSITLTMALAETVNLSVSGSAPPSTSRPIRGNFQSFSIEFAFWPDFGGNHSNPNHFTNTLLANLREFTGEEQILRIGGLTQDVATYYANQTEAIINYWNSGYSDEQPESCTFGPAYWQSLNAIEGVQYIFGLNFYLNTSYYISNLRDVVDQTLLQVPRDRIYLFEIGNEPDNGANTQWRPPTWTQEDYVNEWINRSRSVQVANATTENSLRYYAPSFCCYNITTDYSFFSPWTVWNSTFDYNRDGWIEEVSQHGYISGVGLDPTLQGILMNHTNLKLATLPQVELSTFHNENGQIYTIGETNSVSGEGSKGVSNVFGSALWLVDYALYMASNNVTRMHFHQGTSYTYGSWQPILANGTGPSTNPPYYGNVFVAKFLGQSNSLRVNNIDLDSDYYVVYAGYDTSTEKLAKLALINFHEYDPSLNGTERPVTDFIVPNVNGYKSIFVETLTAPGALSNTSITVGGYSYEYDLEGGNPVKVGSTGTTIYPTENGTYTIAVEDSQAVIVTFQH